MIERLNVLTVERVFFARIKHQISHFVRFLWPSREIQMNVWSVWTLRCIHVMQCLPWISHRLATKFFFSYTDFIQAYLTKKVLSVQFLGGHRLAAFNYVSSAIFVFFSFVSTPGTNTRLSFGFEPYEPFEKFHSLVTSYQRRLAMFFQKLCCSKCNFLRKQKPTSFNVKVDSFE